MSSELCPSVWRPDLKIHMLTFNSKELNREDRLLKKQKISGTGNNNRLQGFKKRDQELANARKKRDREE